MTRPEHPPSDETTTYDVFVSYARRDNVNGRLTALVERLCRAAPRRGTEPLRVFSDVDEIVSMDLWRRRL